jgi:Holliday junction resolvase RusA-like endonuclease
MEVIVIDDGSSSIVQHVDEDAQQEFRVTILGRPLSMPRHRVFKGRFYNTRKREMQDFATRFKERIPRANQGPLFPRRVPVSITIWFLMSRPVAHFVNRNRLGRLKSTALDSTRFPVMIPDIDNLVKFVLDSLKGVAFCDDSQVVRLQAYRMWDNHGQCLGTTVLHLRKHMVEQHCDDPPADYLHCI